MDASRLWNGRTQRSLIVGLLVAGLLLTGAAAVMQPDDPEIPERFGVPETRGGDGGVYTLTTVEETMDGVEVVAEERPVFGFEWRSGVRVVNRSGYAVRANVLDVTPASPDGERVDPPIPGQGSVSGWAVDARHPNRLLALEAGPGRVVSVRQEFVDSDRREPFLPRPGDENVSRETVKIRNATDYPPGPAKMRCGLKSPLRGSTVSTSDPVQLFNSSCRMTIWKRAHMVEGTHSPWGRPFCEDGVTERHLGAYPCGREVWDPAFEAVDEQTVGSHETVVFSVKDPIERTVRVSPDEAASWSRRPPETHVWYARDVPYPIKIVVEQVREEVGSGTLKREPTGRYLVYRLAEFERGEEPLADDPEPERVVEPSVELRPRQRWGPSEAGIDHPFPLSEAFREARDDAADDTLRAFLDDHPEAYTQRAAFDSRIERTGFDPTGGGFVSSGDCKGEAERWLKLRWSLMVSTGRVTDGTDAVYVTVEEIRPLDNTTLEEAWRDPPSRTCYEFRTDPMAAPAGTPVFAASPYVDLEGVPRWEPIPAEDAPDEIPSLASVVETWKDHRSNRSADLEVNTWRFEIGCRPDCANGTHVRVQAGYETARTTPALPGSQGNTTFESLASRIEVDGRGRLGEVEASYHRDRRVRSDLSYNRSLPTGESIRTQAQAAGIPLWGVPASAAFGAGLVGVVAAVLYRFWPAVKSLPFVPGYSRIGEDEALDHPTRSSIHELVADQPGIHFNAIAEHLDLERSVARHHLRKLVDCELLSQRDFEGYTCYWRPGSVDRELIEAAPALKSEGARRILEVVSAAPGRSAKEVAEAAGLSEATVNYHLGRLQDAGLVDKERDGRRVAVRITGMGRRALDVVGPNT